MSWLRKHQATLQLTIDIDSDEGEGLDLLPTNRLRAVDLQCMTCTHNTLPVLTGARTRSFQFSFVRSTNSLCLRGVNKMTFAVVASI